MKNIKNFSCLVVALLATTGISNAHLGAGYDDIQPSLSEPSNDKEIVFYPTKRDLASSEHFKASPFSAPTSSNTVKADVDFKLFEERSDIISGMHLSNEEVSKIAKERDAIAKSITDRKVNERLAQEMQDKGISQETLECLSKDDNLLAQMTAEDAQLYAGLSALSYENFLSGNLRRANKHTAVDQAIEDQSNLLSVLNDYAEKIKKTFDTVKPDKLTKALATHKKNLQSAFGLEIESDSFEDINNAIGAKKLQIKQRIESLQEQALYEQRDEIAALQKALNAHGRSNLEVKGIFYRNDGEFSGFAAYDKTKHQLVLSFAGSKSSWDWIKNFMGWNAKTSARHGLLVNMNIHAGFLSHLEDLSPEAFELAGKIMKDLSELNKDKPLELMGTGHSLGGALSTLFTAAAKQIADKNGIKAIARGMTFGSPNLVHGGSLEKMNEIFGGAGNLVRIEHSKDPVPVACFWKDAPGVSLKYNGDIFWDAANAMQIFGQNPHGINNYYHSVATYIDKWKNNVAGLQTIINEKSSLEAKLAEKKSRLNAAMQQVHRGMTTLINFDRLNYSTLYKSKRAYLNFLSEKDKELKASLIQSVKESRKQEDLSASVYEASVSYLAEIKARYAANKFLLEELTHNNAFEKFVDEDKQKTKRKSQEILSDLSASIIDLLGEDDL